MVVTRVVDQARAVLAEWWLLTNVAGGDADAATIGRWYAWRWTIESYHKLIKSAGMNAEAWQQKSGAAFLRRLCVASMACLTAWHLQRDKSPAAARLRVVLVRLSGRQMKHGVESTAPALLAGLERLLAIDDLMQVEDLDEILNLARRQFRALSRSLGMTHSKSCVHTYAGVGGVGGSTLGSFGFCTGAYTVQPTSERYRLDVLVLGEPAVDLVLLRRLP